MLTHLYCMWMVTIQTPGNPPGSKMENWEQKEERMQGRERVCVLNHFKTFIIFAQWTSISFENLP